MPRILWTTIMLAVWTGALSCLWSPAAARAAMNPAFELDARTLERAGRPAASVTPPPRKRLGAASPSRAPRQRGRRAVARRYAAPAGDRHPVQALRLESPDLSPSGGEAVSRIARCWDSLVPRSAAPLTPLTVHSPSFTLTLDPQRYPRFQAMDGASIVLDPRGEIPDLVRSLIRERDPSVRIVSGAGVGDRRLLAALLGAAGFYSVEENVVMDFGEDPRLRVRADFKVERTAESLLAQDVALINGGSEPLPRPVATLLRGEGFALHEPFASPGAPAPVRPRRILYQIGATGRMEMVDAVLSALALDVRNDQQVDVFAGQGSGIRLSVRAQRYVERNGRRCVVVGFDGDAVAYTLFRILESRGYGVAILDERDDFRTLTGKLLTSLGMAGEYGQQELVADGGSRYSLRMSGFRLEGADVPGGWLMLTNLRLDNVMGELLAEEGVDVRTR